LMFDGFELRLIETANCALAMRVGGSGPPVLLLHGFPETHLMWRDIAAELADNFTVVCADLPGYGASSCPESTPDHAPYSKRAMAKELVHAMVVLGHSSFAVVGHDRGGRVAYRAAFDHADRILAVAVLDVIPIDEAWRRADDLFALGFWPWSLLAQPYPLPERLVSAAPDAVVDDALSQWGSPAALFERDVRSVYVEQLRDPTHIHAICEGTPMSAARCRFGENSARRSTVGRSTAGISSPRSTRMRLRHTFVRFFFTPSRSSSGESVRRPMRDIVGRPGVRTGSGSRRGIFWRRRARRDQRLGCGRSQL